MPTPDYSDFAAGLGTYKPDPQQQFSDTCTLPVQCKMCGRGRIANNYLSVPAFTQCDYCNALHLTAFGWIVVVEESIFAEDESTIHTIISKVINSFTQRTHNSLTEYMQSPRYTQLRHKAKQVFGTRNLTYKDSRDFIQIGLNDMSLLGVPPEPALLMAHSRVNNLAGMGPE